MDRDDAPDASVYSRSSDRAVRGQVKGGRTPGVARGGLNISTPAFRTNAIAALLLLLVTVLSKSTLADASTGSQTRLEVSGGSLVILEQVTATWCDVCATHEQWLDDFDSANPSRVQRVALHSIVDDPLGNPASEVRMEALSTSDSGIVPIYYFDGNQEMLNSQSASQLQSSLLAAEGDRTTFEAIDVIATEKEGSLQLWVEIQKPLILNGTTITVLLLEGMAHLDSAVATNGVTEHPNLLRQSATVPLDGGSPNFVGFEEAAANLTVEGTISASLNLTPGWGSMDDWVILVVHEHTHPIDDGPRTIAAVRLSGDDSDFRGESYAAWPMLAILGLIFAATIRHRPGD